MKPENFVGELKSIELPHVFNPYADQCPVHDRDDAAQLRSKALLDILEMAAATDVHSIWIGRDLGYRGGRRTGLALTDDVHIANHGMRWGVNDVPKATVSGDLKERTATVIWDVLDQINEHVFLWNVFPFHPHEDGEPFSNRAHNSRERQIGEEILDHLIAMLRPQNLVPIGNNAAATAYRLRGNESIVHVRHPSYGGQEDFRRQTGEFYGIRIQQPSAPQLGLSGELAN